MDCLSVYRPNISEYQKGDFFNNEKNALESLNNIKCLTNDLNSVETKDIIVISTSQTNCLQELENLKDFNIKLWLHPNSGYDNLHYDFVKAADFPIILGNEIRANAVALYTVSCIIDSIGMPPFKEDWDVKRAFHRKSPQSINTLLIGYGFIGKKLESFLKSFDFKYSIYDPYKGQPNLNLEQADIILLLSSLNKDSEYFLNEKEFNKLKEDVVIINPSRGKLIKQDALIKFLTKHPRAFAYLDVFEKEPANFKDFASLTNVKLSSHVAGVYDKIDEDIIRFEKKVINDFLNNGSFLEIYNNLLLSNRIQDNYLV